jgi:hypothetical protein
MAIFDYLCLFDTYGVKFNICIKSKKTFNTYLTFTFSLITYILFIIILYFQQEDFLYKTNPNISYIKQDYLTNRDLESVDKHFHLLFDISSEKFKENTLRHLKTNLFLKITHGTDMDKAHETTIRLFLGDCEDFFAEEINIEDGLRPQYWGGISKGTYCLHGFNFGDFKIYNFDKLGFTINAEFEKCNQGDSFCEYSPEFNQAFDNGDIKIAMRIMSTKLDLNFYKCPFYYNYITVKPLIGEIGSAALYSIKLKNTGDQLLTKESQSIKLSLRSKPTIEKTSDNQLIQFNISYNHNVDIYQRQYKTFSAG